jgi:hypothetical protein
MDLGFILKNAGIPLEVYERLVGIGLNSPKLCYSFFVNNPLMIKPVVARGLGLLWEKYDPEKIRADVIRALETSGALAPNYLDMVNRQRARQFSAPLGAPLESPLDQPAGEAPPREVPAQNFVGAVELNIKPEERIDRSLPAEKLDIRRFARHIIPWPVRDQRPTPSCTAFAVAAALELHLARQRPVKVPTPQSAPDRLSSRFLYRNARKKVIEDPAKAAKPAYKGGGLKQGDVAAALAAQGICTESLYRDLFEAGDWADKIEPLEAVKNKPNATTQADALTRRFGLEVLDFPNYLLRPPGLARKVYDWLRQGIPVAVSIPGFSEPEDPTVPGSGRSVIWHDEHFWDTGVLPLPPPHYIVGKPGHVVCVIGYLDLPNLPAAKFPVANYLGLNGYFLFRNSWGSKHFARNSPLPAMPTADANFPRGYGLMPADMMEYFVWEYGIVKPIP